MVALLVLVLSTGLILFSVTSAQPFLLAPRAPVLALDVGKLVIDTDAGGDDAMALLLALGKERREKTIQLVAITCVKGNTGVDNVVVNVLKTLDTAGRLDVSVYRGANDSLLVSPVTDYFFGRDGFGDFNYSNPPDPKNFLKKEHAVIALIDIVSKYPGEITLLCLGPLTNIALAIRLDPLFLTKLRQLVVLGGSVEGVGNVLPGVEFNFYIDPAAAFVVFDAVNLRNTSANPVILIPWESVAERNKVSKEWRVNVLGQLGSQQVKFLNQVERLPLKRPTWSSADTLCTAVVVDPSIVTDTKVEYLDVDPNTNGAVFVDYHNALNMRKNVIIVKSVNVNRFKKMLINNLS